MSTKLLDNFTVICPYFEFKKGQRCHFPDSLFCCIFAHWHPLILPPHHRNPCAPASSGRLELLWGLVWQPAAGSCDAALWKTEIEALWKILGFPLKCTRHRPRSQEGGKEGEEKRGIGEDRKVRKKGKYLWKASEEGPPKGWRRWKLEGKAFELMLYVGYRERRGAGKMWENKCMKQKRKKIGEKKWGKRD